MEVATTIVETLSITTEEYTEDTEEDTLSVSDITVGQVVESQTATLNELLDVAIEGYEKQRQVIALAEKVINHYQETKKKAAEEFDAFIMKSLDPSQVTEDLKEIKPHLENFEKGINEAYDIHLKVKQKMKEHEKVITEQDDVVRQYAKNHQQFNELKAKLESMAAEFAPKIPPIPSTTSLCQSMSSEYAMMANRIPEPYKALETEISTYTVRIVDDILQLREFFKSTPEIVKLTEPAILQSKLVAKMVLKETPVKTIGEFLQTLPPGLRD